MKNLFALIFQVYCLLAFSVSLTSQTSESFFYGKWNTVLYEISAAPFSEPWYSSFNNDSIAARTIGEGVQDTFAFEMLVNSLSNCGSAIYTQSYFHYLEHTIVFYPCNRFTVEWTRRGQNSTPFPGVDENCQLRESTWTNWFTQSDSYSGSWQYDPTLDKLIMSDTFYGSAQSPRNYEVSVGSPNDFEIQGVPFTAENFRGENPAFWGLFSSKLKFSKTSSPVSVIDTLAVFHLQNASTGLVRKPMKISNLSIAADSSRSTVFRLKGFDLQNLAFRIFEDSNGVNPNEFGKLEVLSANADSVLVLYQHPSYLNVSGAKDRLIELQIYDTICNNVLKKYPVKIVRPSVLMIHGLWSSGEEAFAEMEQYLFLSGMYNSHQLKLANYPNARHFYQNIPIILIEIKALLAIDRMHNVSSGKVDIVAHSMGGILSRLYLQSDNYRNDINRLITLNTPHSGSQIANFLLGSEGSVLLSPLKAVGKDPTLGAISDLRVNSIAIRETLNGLPNNLNKRKVATHAIVTTQAFPSTNPLIINIVQKMGWPGFILAQIAAISNGIANIEQEIFNGELHDIIVPLSSQQGGLPINAITTFDDQWHSSTSNFDVQNEVKLLLNADPNSALFTKQGYDPAELESQYFLPKLFNTEQSPILLNSTVKIQYPPAGKDYFAGDTVQIHVSGEGSTNKIVLAMGNEKIMLQNRLAFSADSIFSLIIPERAIGRLNIIGIGFDDNGYVDLDTSYIIVNVTAGLDSIKIREELIYVAQNTTAGITILGYYNDQVVRDLSQMSGPAIEAVSGLVVPQSLNQILGLAIGTDTIKVNYLGKSDFATVVIIDPSEWAPFPIDSGLVSTENYIAAANHEPIFSIFPNPSNGTFTIESHNFMDNVDLKICDLIGNVVYWKRFQNSEELNAERFDLLINNGIYFITLACPEFVRSNSIIVNRQRD